MERERGWIRASRIVAVLAGLTTLVAAWYVLMSVAFGDPPSDRSTGWVVTTAVAWVVAGAAALIAGGLLDSPLVRPAARLDLLAGVLVVATVPLLGAPIALIPATAMLMAAAGERYARYRARADAFVLTHDVRTAEQDRDVAKVA